MNENHKRVMTAYLDDMERKLREVQTDIASTPHDAAPRNKRSANAEIEEETRGKLMRGITEMLSEFESLRRNYGLEVEGHSVRKHASSVFIDILVTISELSPKTLENYGPMTRADKDSLRPEVEKLIKTLDGLFSALAAT